MPLWENIPSNKVKQVCDIITLPWYGQTVRMRTFSAQIFQKEGRAWFFKGLAYRIMGLKEGYITNKRSHRMWLADA
jgi:hypothetical protein